jgi:hypothetical protein
MTQVTDFERENFELPKQKNEYVGQVATPRHGNVFERQAYVPPKRFVRDDVPDWSVRTGMSFHTKA